MKKDKQQFGQYMTPQLICDFMVEMIEHDKSDSVLEPACGDGAFLKSLKNHSFFNVKAYEIDQKIIDRNFNVQNESFVSSSIDEKFDVVIGNPPYIRWKNMENNLKKELENSSLWNTYCNSLCDYSSIFIIKSIEQLNPNGELIFITPEYWLSTTHSSPLRNYILSNGYISEIYHFNETPIFQDVTVSLIIFKFIKNKAQKRNLKVVKYFSKKKLTECDIKNIKNKSATTVKEFTIPQYEQNSRWILADTHTQNIINQFEIKCAVQKYDFLFSNIESKCNYEKIGTYFDIGNGMVSGLDKAFQIPDNFELTAEEIKASLQVLKAKNIEQYTHSETTRYIFINKPITEEEFKTSFPNYHSLLQQYVEPLKKRYNYNREIPYWEWVFLRNYNLFSKQTDRILVPCKERITKKSRFRFCLADNTIYPTQDVTALLKKSSTKEDILYVLALLNSKYVFDWLSYKGIRKGDIIEFSEKPLSMIPFRKIDFKNPVEVKLHDTIVSLTNDYINTKNKSILDEIDINIDKLME